MSYLRYVTDSKFEWKRVKKGKAFSFVDSNGKPIAKEGQERVEKLVIPPAWTDVKLSQFENGHIQAVGFDARGRKQYIYHPDWIRQKQQHKFDKMVRFGEVLPSLRETLAGHMRQRTLSRERVLATITWLLEHTFVRVGNKEYARENQSYGLTTLREKHVSVDGKTVTFRFAGKSGVDHEVDINNPRVVRTIHECLELPGYELFQYLDDDGVRQQVDSRDVNEYLQIITGEELSAKDFRTWGGTTLAGDFLYRVGNPDSDEAAKKSLVAAVKEVSHQLRNTVAVCRTYYIHPTIVKSYEKKLLVPHFDKVHKHPRKSLTGLSIEEQAAWTLLKA